MADLEFEEDNYKISILNERTLYIQIKDFQELQREDIISMQDWVRGKTTNSKFVNLIQFGNGSSATREAREFASSPEGNSITIGSALLVRNLAQQLIIDYYIKFNNPMYPTKVFYKYDKAISWIDGLIKEN